jgi:hypothetical protein
MYLKARPPGQHGRPKETYMNDDDFSISRSTDTRKSNPDQPTPTPAPAREGPDKEMIGLPGYDSMLRAIGECTWEAITAEVEAIEDPAERLRIYAALARNTNLERMVSDIRLRGKRNVSNLLGFRPRGRRGL